MFNNIEFEVKSSKRNIDCYNIIEDELEILIDAAYGFKIDDKYMNVLKAFNNLIKTLNHVIVDTPKTIEYVKELNDSYHEAESIDKNIVLNYIEKWVSIIFKRIIKYDIEKINKIIIEYIDNGDRNGSMDFYLYVIHEYYKRYYANRWD